jgi:hypothetical protein
VRGSEKEEEMEKCKKNYEKNLITERNETGESKHSEKKLSPLSFFFTFF